MENKAKQYSEGKSSSDVFRRAHEADYLVGYKQALEDSHIPEMLELIQDLSENLALQLGRLGCCGEGDGKDRRADNDSFGGSDILNRVNEFLKS